MTDANPTVYVYGVVKAADETKVEGGDAPIRRVAHESVAALVSDTGSGELSAARAVRAHWRVVAEAAARTTVLPVRFGTVMAGDDAVRHEFLAPRAERLSALLDEFEGKVQVTVKGSYDEDRLLNDVVRGSPEIARLRERTRNVPEAAGYYDRIQLGELVTAEIDRRRAAHVELVVTRLEPLALAAAAEPPTTNAGAVNAAFLVERERLEPFADAVRRLADELGDAVRLRYLGPLPPYSFTGEESGRSMAWA